eukprot:TRINITY_DN37_c0_g1_i2.p2 TRINITY_DN37_c0_g1~~TRINITY_DN37_c0_g1_i2.p2  ORF type:complete len:176 (+),score=57.71 TRINITY_DN37_c0_g1_i2:873-1400(+)
MRLLSNIVKNPTCDKWSMNSSWFLQSCESVVKITHEHAVESCTNLKHGGEIGFTGPAGELCTVEELKNKCANGPDCDNDADWAWAADECDPEDNILEGDRDLLALLTFKRVEVKKECAGSDVGAWLRTRTQCAKKCKDMGVDYFAYGAERDWFENKKKKYRLRGRSSETAKAHRG